MEIVEVLEELLPLDSPFAIKEIIKNEEDATVYIHIEVDKSYRPYEHYGGIHQYYDRTWEHLKLFEYRCFITCRLPIFKNAKTGKTEAMKVAFSRPNSRFTILYEKEVMRLMGIHYCLKSVAQQLHIHTQRVEKIYHHYTSTAFDQHEVEPCSSIGVDETSTRKGHHYITTIVNMDTGKPIDVLDGKGSEVLKEFFDNNVNPAQVKQISIDMSPAFISGCGQYFPWASQTFDKWHVFKLFGKHLDKLYKKFKDKQGQIALIWEYLEQFYQLKDWLEAKAFLSFIADYAEEVFGKNSFSKSIRRHFDGIVEYIRSRLTNGILEGINSKTQTIKRVARGFRYTENFKKMILFAFGVIQPRFTT